MKHKSGKTMLFGENLQTDIQLFAKLTDDVQPHTGTLTAASSYGTGKPAFRYPIQFMSGNPRTIVRKGQNTVCKRNADPAAPAVFSTVDEKLLEDEHKEL